MQGVGVGCMPTRQLWQSTTWFVKSEKRVLNAHFMVKSPHVRQLLDIPNLFSLPFALPTVTHCHKNPTPARNTSDTALYYRVTDHMFTHTAQSHPVSSSRATVRTVMLRSRHTAQHRPVDCVHAVISTNAVFKINVS
jgi:hypothetical protein